jgi:hypothetical protein
MEEYIVKVNDEGTIIWYQEGKLHRVGGPAIECLDGYKAWYQKDKLHRADGYAVEYTNGSKFWYIDGKLHRLDGPAVEYTDGSKEWHIDGKEYTQDEFDKIINLKVKELTLEEICSLLGYKIKIVR